MTKTFSFETPVNDGKDLVGDLFIIGQANSVSEYNLDSVRFYPAMQSNSVDILPLFKHLGLVDTLTFIPVTAHLIKLWGAEEPEAFIEDIDDPLTKSIMKAISK